MRETDGMVQVWCVKSCLIILFCQVCNVRSESDRGGGYNQQVKLDTDQVFSGQLAVSGVLNRQNGNESGNIRHNQRIRSKSSTRDAKCKFSSPSNSIVQIEVRTTVVQTTVVQTAVVQTTVVLLSGLSRQ